MKNHRVLFPLFLLACMMLTGCDSSDNFQTCITGTVRLIEHEGLTEYVFIEDLEFPSHDTTYDYIEMIVVPKEEFPSQDYQSGDIISFTIKEIISPFPPFTQWPYTPPTYTCFIGSIQLCQ